MRPHRFITFWWDLRSKIANFHLKAVMCLNDGRLTNKVNPFVYGTPYNLRVVIKDVYLWLRLNFITCSWY